MLLTLPHPGPYRSQEDDGGSGSTCGDGPSALEQHMAVAAGTFAHRQAGTAATRDRGGPLGPVRAESPAPQAQRQRRREQQQRRGSARSTGRASSGRTMAVQAAAPEGVHVEAGVVQQRVEYMPPPRRWLQQSQELRVRSRVAHLLPPTTRRPRPSTAQLASAGRPPGEAGAGASSNIVTAAVWNGAWGGACAGALAGAGKEGLGPGRGGVQQMLAHQAGLLAGWDSWALPPTACAAPPCTRPLSAPAGPHAAAQPSATGPLQRQSMPERRRARGRPFTAAVGAGMRTACWGPPSNSAEPGAAGAAVVAAAAASATQGLGAGAAALLFPQQLRPQWDSTPLLPSQHLRGSPSCGGGAGADWQRLASPPRSAATAAAAQPRSPLLAGGAAAAPPPPPPAALPYLRGTLAAVREANRWCRALGGARHYQLVECRAPGSVRHGGAATRHQIGIEVWEEQDLGQAQGQGHGPWQPSIEEERSGAREAAISAAVAAWGWAAAAAPPAAPAARRLLTLQQFHQHHRELQARLRATQGATVGSGRGCSRGGVGSSSSARRVGSAAAASTAGGRPSTAAVTHRCRCVPGPPGQRSARGPLQHREPQPRLGDAGAGGELPWGFAASGWTPDE
jgi:hypothetical protein